MRHRQRRHARGQAMVEMALVLPIFIIITLGIVDISRLFLAQGALRDDANRAARLMSLPVNANSDCAALAAGADNAGGMLNISADPHSIVGAPQSPPSSPTGANQGFVYLYPAMATADPPTANCTSGSSRASGTVYALETYNFGAYAPFLSAFFNVTIQVKATTPTQY